MSRSEVKTDARRKIRKILSRDASDPKPQVRHSYGATSFASTVADEDK